MTERESKELLYRRAKRVREARDMRALRAEVAKNARMRKRIDALEGKLKALGAIEKLAAWLETAIREWQRKEKRK